jgi:hypothetical protein
VIRNQEDHDDSSVNEAVMQVYNLCKYSILTNCLYKIPLAVLEGQSKYKDPRSLCSIIVDAATEEDKPFIELMV